MQPREIPITINIFLFFFFNLFNQMPRIPTIHNRKNSKGTCNPMKCGENDIVKTRSPINLKNEELDNLKKEESTKIWAYNTFRFTSDIGGELTSSIIATFISWSVQFDAKGTWKFKHIRHLREQDMWKENIFRLYLFQLYNIFYPSFVLMIL